MIRFTIEGFGGWLCALLFLAGYPYCWFMGRGSGRFDEEMRQWDREDERGPELFVPVPEDEQVLVVTRTLPDGSSVHTRYIADPS